MRTYSPRQDPDETPDLDSRTTPNVPPGTDLLATLRAAIEQRKAEIAAGRK